MTHEEYRKKRLEKRSRRIARRHIGRDRMDAYLSNPPTDTVRHPRIKSAKKFIKMGDGTTCLTFLYEVKGYSGYACKKVEVIHREPVTLLERCCDKICWK